MSKSEAMESNRNYRRQHYTAGAFSTDEIRFMVNAMRESITCQSDSDLCSEFEEELKIRSMEKDQ